MAKILDEVMKELPKSAKIADAVFEGANIVLYSKDKDFIFDNKGYIKKVVDKIKKRVELRPDPSMCLDIEKTKDIISEIVPKEAEVGNVIFDSQRSEVIIEAEKPGLVIGKSGELLKEIKQKTLWVPLVKRLPAIRSPLIENIRQVLYDNSDYRRKFLHKIGKRIYESWSPTKKEGWVRVSILGAGREVGRSCYLLQTNESNILLDCGLNVAASDSNMFPILEASEFNIKELDAVIISHAHLDHVGCLPYLYKMGYRGPCYMTLPTRDVSSLLCLDAIGISQKEARDALYGSSDVKEMVRHCVCLDYGEVSDITPDVRITFYNAGHNLGSSVVHMHIGNGLHNFVYSGDFNYEVSNLLGASVNRFPRVESVMMESTYGSRKDVNPSRKECEDELIGIINNVCKRKGKVVMPVLGVGRSQEIMIILERAMREGKIPKMPIFLQGMVWDVTAIHTAYPDFFNVKVKQSIFQRDQNPFLASCFKHVTSRKEMKEVIETKGPYIIMATSGMLTGGASLEYFKSLCENKLNALVLTCYQGVGSLGRRLQSGERDVYFTVGAKQEKFSVGLEVFTISGFSGHSNYKQLCSWVSRMEPRPKKILVVHGEQSKCLELASSIYQANRIETSAPKNLETVRLR